jgi:uncharacterized Ntn-hydrolase superfamily protein
MTWSILARDEAGRFGVAIASRFFAVGALCVHTRRGVGALSTQALMNPLYGPRGMALLAEGRTPAEGRRTLTAPTPAATSASARPARARPPAAWTGAACVDWCGHRWARTSAWPATCWPARRCSRPRRKPSSPARGRDLAERLLAAMAAGEAAGGDKRGKQAAALRIHGRRGLPAAGPARRRPRGAGARTAAPVPQEPGALPALHGLPGRPARPGGHHRPHADRGAHRALPARNAGAR